MPHHRHHKIQTHKASREDSNGNVHETHAEVQGGEHVDNHQVVQCCVPSGCLQTGESIDPSDPGNSVKVVCNNDQCKEGIWMHRECFVEWENVVLAYLKSCGRARSWSEKQRLQNLWTKKGYDLAFKACDCKCGRGHLRKDLDYFAPPKVDNAKKPKKKTKKNDRPMPVVSNNKNGHYNSNANTGGGNINTNNNQLNGNINQNHTITGILTNNANRNADANQNANLQANGNVTISNVNKNLSSVKKESNPSVNATSNNNNVGDRNNNSNGSTNSVSWPINANVRPRTNSGSCSSPGKLTNHVAVRPRTDSLGSAGSSSPVSMGSGSLSSSPCMNGNTCTFAHNVRTAKAKFDPNTDIAAVQAAMTNLFKRRHDLSAFNILPRHKQNPYHIKMEDEGPPGNDEIRVFVLAHLGSYRVTSLNCVLCKRNLPVFDRYPMIDGTFFLSPQAYDDSVVQVVSDGRLQYINAVCVNCLEGANDVRCKACKQKWDGSALLLGSMYSYDIFAAMPCCQKRLSCKHCHRAVVDIGGGLPFYSAYSRMIACPYCKAHDYHFIRPMAETFAVKDVIWN